VLKNNEIQHDKSMKSAQNATKWHFTRILRVAQSATLWHSMGIMGSEQNRNSLLRYMENLQAQGRLVFTAEDAQAALGESANAFIKASLRLIKKGKLFRPTKGFYVVIPAEYKNSGSVPPEWYIDSLMKFHGLPYYVGGLSAAAFHGASHQAPQELQVITTKKLRPVINSRTRIRFLTKKNISKVPVQEIKTHTGFFKVSSPEATAFDLIRYYRWSGYFNNIATVLIELSEKIDSKKLARAADIEGDIAQAQRLGHLLDRFGKEKPISELAKWVSQKTNKFMPLRPGWKGEVQSRDEKWRIQINDDVEPDL